MLFSANNVLQPIKDLPKYCKAMEYLAISGNILAKAEYQPQSINLVKWNNNTDTEHCWSDVKEFKDYLGNNPSSEIFLMCKASFDINEFQC